MEFILLLWYIMVIAQTFFGYGSAYRLTKKGGDNGVALWGWMFLMGLAALIPGLGIYIWVKSKDEDDGYNISRNAANADDEEEIRRLNR